LLCVLGDGRGLYIGVELQSPKVAGAGSLWCELLFQQTGGRWVGATGGFYVKWWYCRF
jgi:hypothetical protein